MCAFVYVFIYVYVCARTCACVLKCVCVIKYICQCLCAPVSVMCVSYVFVLECVCVVFVTGTAKERTRKTNMAYSCFLGLPFVVRVAICSSYA